MRTDHTTPRPPRFLMSIIGAALVIGIAATLLSVANAFAIGRESDEREFERIQADVSACDRGNVIRRQIVDQSVAAEDLIEGILEQVFVNVRDQDLVAALKQRLQPLFDQHREAIDAVEIVDCEAVIPGADRVRPTTTTTEAPS